jgi:hypothetical protein
VVGHHLDRLTGEVRVDGQPVTVTERGPSEVRFRMPSPRRCETDGRPIRVETSAGTATASLTVPGLLTFEVGESRVLDVESLRACTRIPSGQEYVLSVLSLARDTAWHQLISLRTFGSISDTTITATFSAPRASEASRRTRLDPLLDPTDASAMPLAPAYSAALATAAPGETVSLVDWSRTACSTPRERAATVSARVAAVEGSVVVLVDEAVPGRDAFLSGERATALRKAAALTDAHLLPTLRSLVGSDFTAPAGAGGRVFVLLDVATPTLGLAQPAEVVCAAGTNVMLTTMSASLAGSSTLSAGDLAAVMVHENFHVADVVTRRRRAAPAMLAWGEAWATAAEETASRLSLGEITGASPSSIDPTRHIRFTHSVPANDSERWSPWTGGGSYAADWLMLLYAREVLQQANPRDIRGEMLYERLLNALVPLGAAGGYPSLIAAALGMPVDTLLDRVVTAQTLDDRLPPGVAESRNLPQIRSWSSRIDPADVANWLVLGQRRVVLRMRNQRHHLAARGGAFEHLVFPTGPSASIQGTAAAQGVSFEVDAPLQTSSKVLIRLTRIR